MKNIIFIALFLITTSLFSQVEMSHIGVNKQFMSKDTLSTFTLIKPENTDHFIDNMLAHFGRPDIHEAGRILWSDVEITNIGKELTVKLKDGILFINENGDLVETPFKDEKDKAENLSNMNSSKQKKYRFVDIAICDAEGLNIINTKHEVDVAKNLLEKIYMMK
ncbi:MAG: hypothetical protein GX259_08890 [Bacteroidales bacterium]|nr:hypothetical protein [Bacteroidales bacterium]